MPLTLADPVAEGQKTVGKVDALKLHVRIVAGDLLVGKGPKAPDAEGHQVVHSGLGGRLGNSEQGYVGEVLPAVVVQFLH